MLVADGSAGTPTPLIATVASARVRPGRPRGSACGDPAGLVDVALDLRHELVDPVEPLLAAQPLEELQLDLLAVEVALEVEQVGLDQHAQGGLELGRIPIETAAVLTLPSASVARQA